MSFHLDIEKLAQCTGYLLKRYPGATHNYFCIVKMLYLADRESISRIGSPITGDTPYALDNGPILSHLLDFIKGVGREYELTVWDRYFSTRDYDVACVLEPQEDRLSTYDREVLDAIFEQHGGKDWRELRVETHNLPEWIECQPREGSSNVIELKSMLRAVNREEQYDAISQRRIEDSYFAQMFGG